LRVQACGVCHTDLHYREGGIKTTSFVPARHEAAGIVEEVGPDVTGVRVGDFVVLKLASVCGTCRACRRGEPQYCFALQRVATMTLADAPSCRPRWASARSPIATLVAAGPVHARRPEGLSGRRWAPRLCA